MIRTILTLGLCCILGGTLAAFQLTCFEPCTQEFRLLEECFHNNPNPMLAVPCNQWASPGMPQGKCDCVRRIDEIEHCLITNRGQGHMQRCRNQWYLQS